MKELEDFYKNSIVGLRVGSLYVYKQYLMSNTVFCYCSNCNKSNIEIPVAKMQYWLKHNKAVTCGCEVNYKDKEKHLLNYGASYSKLTIVKKNKNKIYECLCECGNLIVVDEEHLKNNITTQCQNCKSEEIKNKRDSYQDRVRKELYYIWNSFLYLYKYPTEDFKYKILDKEIKFFQEFNNDFELFYNWALSSEYREGGKIYLEREDKKKDYAVDNCKWSKEDKSKFIDLPKSILKNSKDEVLEKGNLTRQMTEIAENENRKEVKEAKERLINYFYIHYGIKFVPKSIQETLKQLNNGTSKTYENVKITYEELLDMLKYYENDLFNLHSSKIKKGKCLSPNERMAYDISIMIDRLDDYNNRKEVLYNQVNNNNFNTIEDFSIYLEPIQISRKKESQKEFEKIEEIKKFVEDVLVTFDKDDDA